MSDELLLDEPLIADTNAEEEMGPNDAEPIADEDLKGSRLLLIRRAVEAIDLEGTPGGAVELVCTFQPARNARFTWAQIVLKLTMPDGLRFLDVAPHDVKEGDSVKFTVDIKGKLGVKHVPAEAGIEAGEKKEFSIYHCAVQGSGAGTALARWDFRENPHTQAGLGQDQSLTLTLPCTGKIRAEARVATRIARAGVGGAIQALRDLVLGRGPEPYTVSFEIPAGQDDSVTRRFSAY